MLENGLSQRPTEEDVIDACWSRIGVRGDQSCPRLQDFFRCLNCPTYAASAAQLLDRPTRTELAAANLNWQGEQTEAAGQGCVDASALIFRIGDEWLGLATTSIVEVIESRAMHSLPHQANPAVLGLTNIRGTLKICVAMGRMLGMADSTVKTATRALVVEHEQQVLVFPVDEVAGVHGYATASLQPPPSMAQQTGSTYTQAVLSWRDHKVGLLDGGLLFYTLNRSLI